LIAHIFVKQTPLYRNGQVKHLILHQPQPQHCINVIITKSF